MGKARHPGPYNEGPRRQITIPWKKRALAKLESNKAAGLTPANQDQLMTMVGAKKGGINSTLKVTGKQQFTSTYADDITRILEIDPPLVETEEDDEHFVRYVTILRSLTPQAQHELMRLAATMEKKTR